MVVLNDCIFCTKIAGVVEGGYLEGAGSDSCRTAACVGQPLLKVAAGDCAEEIELF